MMRRSEQILVLLAAAGLALLLLMALLPEQRHEPPAQQTPEPIVTPAASPPAPPARTPTEPPAYALRVEQAAAFELDESDVYTLPMRVYNDGSLPASNVQFFFGWQADRVHQTSWSTDIPLIPPGASVTIDPAFENVNFSGPGSYSFTVVIHGREHVSADGHELLDNRVEGSMTIQPGVYQCDQEPNLRILTETLTLRNEYMDVRVRNEGAQRLGRVKVTIEWVEGTDPAGHVTLEGEIHNLRPCGGEAWVSAALGSAAGPGDPYFLMAGTPLTLTVSTMPLAPGLPPVHESSYEDNQLATVVR